MTAKWTDFVASSVLTAQQLNDVLDNFQDIAIFNETQAQNTNGGTNVATTWTKRVLNTTVVNNIASCTLSTSVISLPAGTYCATVHAPIYSQNSGATPDAFRHRLQNTTAGTTLGLTASGYSGGNLTSTINSSFVTAFTLSATSNLEIQYYITGVATNTGLGRASNIASTSEIYSQICIARIA